MIHKKARKKTRKQEKKERERDMWNKKDRSQKKVARGRAGPTLYINNHNDKEDICIIKMKSTKLLQEKRKKKACVLPPLENQYTCHAHNS